MRRRFTLTAEVDLGDIPTDELAAELRTRKDQREPPPPPSGLTDFSIDANELHAIKRLFATGRDAEAADRCRALIGELLGCIL